MARFAPISGALLCLAAACHALNASEAVDFFENKIRPVLAEHCYQCHSAGSEKLKGNLRLDTREGVLKGGDTGPALIPGDAEKSLLIKAIRRIDDDLAMPPKTKLPGNVVDDFIRWVNGGAVDPRTGAVQTVGAPKSSFWSFAPPKPVQIPEVRNSQWPQTAIDYFILRKLEENGLAPSPEADKRTLIRRVTYDLTGLPPTAAEVDAFLADRSREAYPRLIERLLASPRYGERWGRYWLDLARYADNKGYVYGDREEARFVHSHVYRDWVINAFNRDLPYDQFLVLQLAADRVATNRTDLAALGFLTLGRRFLGVMHDIIDDRIDTLTRATQALTVSCARCHDHKFDPIPTQDYYSLYGIFAGSTERTVTLPTSPSLTAGNEAYETELKKRTDKLQQTFQEKKEKLEASLRRKTSEYLLAQLTADELPTEEFYAIRGPDDLNPYIVRQWQAYLFQVGKGVHPIFAPWHRFASLPSRDFDPQAARAWQELTNQHGNQLNSAVRSRIEAKPPSSMKEVAALYGKLFEEVNSKWLASTNGGKPWPSKMEDPAEEQLRQVLYAAGSPVLVPEGAMVDLEWFFDEGARVNLGKLQSEIDRWNIQSEKAPPWAVVLEDRPVQHNARVFRRGNPANRGEEVPRQYLALISGATRRPASEGSGRLEMARAIVDSKNPLTARVMVNRVWLHHFGSGLVKTPSDFGTRSEAPSHPELLDYLALRFMQEGWSIKNLHRLILRSSAYQQRSDVVAGRERGSTPSHWARAEKVDPENRLLWRMNRQRLDFEAMRDSLLAVTGEMEWRSGGKPVDLFKGSSTPKRRTIYGFVDRQFLPGLLRVFDFANPDMHSPQRYLTTVPQQALFFMNSPFVVERARALGGKAAAAKPSEQVRGMYRQVYQRDPTPRELEIASRFLRNAETPSPATNPVVVTAWKYGYGQFDTNQQRMKTFIELPHFTGDAWQGGEKWPDAKLGWVRLTREGGHTGNDLDHAAVRRWTAPYDSVVKISGTIHHEKTEGDGIRAQIISSRSGVLGSWALHNRKQEVKLDAVSVSKGDTIDFVTDLAGGLNNDEFKWAPAVQVNADKASVTAMAPGYETQWDAKKEFAGPPVPPPPPLTPTEKFAQVLLLANEFLFVD